jgi:26S proteasome regulatory subunit N2
MREINERERFSRGAASSQQSTPHAGQGARNEPGAGSGAAAAAGVLTAVDEDQEGDEEAPVPDAFDYHTDAEEDDE